MNTLVREPFIHPLSSTLEIPQLVPGDDVSIGSDDFEYIPLDVDLSSSRGEAFHGLTEVGDWLVQAPQDHHSLVFYHTKTGEIKEVDVSKYGRLTSKTKRNFRDKFNGIAYDGEYIWVCPSWATHLLQLCPVTFSIIRDFEVNANVDDAFNGLVVTQKYVWLVPHCQEKLVRVSRNTQVVTYFNLCEPQAGDYHFGHGAANRSFLGGCDNKDGTVFFFPRRSNYLIRVEEETGKVISRHRHSLAHLSNPSHGYFHDATMANGRIWFSPWGYSKVVWFDIQSEEFGLEDVQLSGNGQFSFYSCTDGRFIWCPPFRASELIKIDTWNNRIHVIDASEMRDTYIAHRRRSFGSPAEGFAGACLVKDGYVWFSSCFEACFLKLKIKEHDGPLGLVFESLRDRLVVNNAGKLDIEKSASSLPAEKKVDDFIIRQSQGKRKETLGYRRLARLYKSFRKKGRSGLLQFRKRWQLLVSSVSNTILGSWMQLLLFR